MDDDDLVSQTGVQEPRGVTQELKSVLVDEKLKIK